MSMFLELRVTKPPTMDISSAGVNITVPGSVAVLVVDPKTKAMKLAFTLGLVSVPI